MENLDENVYEKNNDDQESGFDSQSRQHDIVSGKQKKDLAYYLREFGKCVTSDPVHKSEMIKRAHFKGINSVSKCDRVARIFFPTSFFFLNILYWYNYYNK